MSPSAARSDGWYGRMNGSGGMPVMISAVGALPQRFPHVREAGFEEGSGGSETEPRQYLRQRLAERQGDPVRRQRVTAARALVDDQDRGVLLRRLAHEAQARHDRQGGAEDEDGRRSGDEGAAGRG